MLKDGLFPCREQVDFRVGIGLATRNRARSTSRPDLNNSDRFFSNHTGDVMNTIRNYMFRDADALVRWVRLSIYAQLAISLIAVVAGYLEYGVLSGIRDGVFASQQAAIDAAEASDARQGLIGLAQIVISIVSGILILRWIHRANWNARALGARNMDFTPGWSIGWYFVPFMNLWKPYMAMKEIWRASARPGGWQGQIVPNLLGLWWFFWIVSSVLGNASFRLTMRAKAVDELIQANIVTVLSDLFTVPLCLVFLVLVIRIHRMQSSGSGYRDLDLTPMPG